MKIIILFLMILINQINNQLYVSNTWYNDSRSCLDVLEPCEFRYALGKQNGSETIYLLDDIINHGDPYVISKNVTITSYEEPSKIEN
jgi:hypothetical protein